MTVPDMSDTCKQYVRCLLQGVMRSSFQYLSLLQDKELFRALAVPAREDIDELFEEEPEQAQGFAPEIPGVRGVKMGAAQRAAVNAAALGGKVLERIGQMTYSYHVVSAGKLNFEKGAAPPNPASDAWAKNYLHHCVALHEIPLDIDEDLTDSLPDPIANPPVLNEADYRAAATTLGVDVPAIKAVAQVESSGSGFGADGRPILRFELHRFQAKTKGVFRKTHPHVSQPSLAAGAPYHNGRQSREYSLLYNAMLLDDKGNSMAEPAIESASWGKFQVMGENWSSLGWASALDFASDMYVSEGNQLKACVKYIQTNGLTHALKTHNWAAFALGYNGPAYADNDYDTNLQRAFNRISAAHP